MDIISYTEARNNLADCMNKVCADHSPIAITRRGNPPVVMMSQQDYDGLMETMYLTSTAANRKDLEQALQDYREGKFVKHDLIEVD
jgi:antitoxin YefM